MASSAPLELTDHNSLLLPRDAWAHRPTDPVSLYQRAGIPRLGLTPPNLRLNGQL